MFVIQKRISYNAHRIHNGFIKKLKILHKYFGKSIILKIQNCQNLMYLLSYE